MKTAHHPTVTMKIVERKMTAIRLAASSSFTETKMKKEKN